MERQLPTYCHYSRTEITAIMEVEAQNQGTSLGCTEVRRAAQTVAADALMPHGRGLNPL